MEHPDTITIEVAETEEVFADQVDLYLTIEGKSLFTGQEALKKAKEVRGLVEGLASIEFPETNILLESVQGDVSTGIISKQSSAIYKLRIKCQKLEALADILGIITSQKNTDLTQMIWRYSNPESFQNKLLEKCLRKSKDKANKVASFLGVDLLGVRDFNEQIIDSETDVQPLSRRVRAGEKMAFKARVTQEELGLSVSHSKRVTVKLTVKYRISPLKGVKQGG